MIFTLEPAPYFPVGTSVVVYKSLGQLQGRTGPPPGEQIGVAQVVQANGALVFEGLPENAGYIAYANVEGKDRYIGFQTERKPSEAQIVEVQGEIATITEELQAIMRELEGVSITPTSPPVVNTLAATLATPAGATLNASVANAGTFFFEYGPTTAYGSRTPSVTLALSATAVIVEVAVSAAMTAATHVRVVASNPTGTSRGVDRQVGPMAPTATMEPVTGGTPTRAVVHAQIQPNALETAYVVELGPTTAYGTLGPAGTVAAGTSPVAIAPTITGLFSSTTWVRVRVSNASGVEYASGVQLGALTEEQSAVAPVVVAAVGATPAKLQVGGVDFVAAGVTLWMLPDAVASSSKFAEEEYANRVALIKGYAGPEWGFDIARLRVLASYYNGLSTEAKATYVAQLKSVVETLNANGMYASITSWDTNDGTYKEEKWATEYVNTHAMWEAIWAALGNNAMVLYEPANEPNHVSWAQWKTAMLAELAFWRNTIGYRGVLRIAPRQWANSGTAGEGYSEAEYDAIVAKDVELLGKANIAFTKHQYATETSFSEATFLSSVGGPLGKYVIWPTEIGNYNGPGLEHITWTEGAATALAAIHAAHANICGTEWFIGGPWLDANKITTNHTAVIATAYGVVIQKNYLKLTPPLTSMTARLSVDKKSVESTGVPTGTTSIEVGYSINAIQTTEGETEFEFVGATSAVREGRATHPYVAMQAKGASGELGSYTARFHTEPATTGGLPTGASQPIGADIGGFGVGSTLARDEEIATHFNLAFVNIRTSSAWIDDNRVRGFAEKKVKIATMIFGEGGTIGSINATSYAAEIVTWFKKYGKGGTFWAGHTDLGCQCVEVLNEPGGSWFWSDPTNYAGYVNLCKVVHEALAKEFAEAVRPVLLASYDGGLAGSLVFGEKCKALGLLAVCDGVTVHPYGGSEKQYGGSNGDRTKVEKANSQTGKNVFVTELGWPVEKATGDSALYSAKEQAENITSFATFMKGKTYAAMFVYYNWIGNYGVSSSEATHREGFAALGKAAGLQ
jgi:hypothetical protein